MNELGIQWQIESEAVRSYNRLVQPTALKSIDGRTRGFWLQLKADNPHALLVYRHYPNFDWQPDPEGCAVRAVEAIRTEIGIPENRSEYLLDVITHVEDNNEWIHSFMTADFDAADRYMAAFIREAWKRLGLRTVFGNFACGHFAEETASAFPWALEAAAEYEAVIGFHEYDWPTMDRIHLEDVAKGGGGFWLCGKWKRAMPAIRERYGDIKCLITECGVDGGVASAPGVGWRGVSPDDELALQSYCGDHGLRWYNDLLNQDDYVIGALIFGCSMHGDWGSFDIVGSRVPEMVAQFPVVSPPEPPPEPPAPPTPPGEVPPREGSAADELEELEEMLLGYDVQVSAMLQKIAKIRSALWG